MVHPQQSPTQSFPLTKTCGTTEEHSTTVSVRLYR